MRSSESASSAWTASITAGLSMRHKRLTVPSASVASPHGLALRCGFEMGPRVALVEREDGGEVVAGRLCEAKAILLGSWLGSLVRADEPGAVVGHANAAEEAAAGMPRAVGALVLLLERPERLVAVGREHALERPGLERLGGVLVGVAPSRRDGQVELDDVEGRALDEGCAHRFVDDVVGRGDDVAEGRDGAERVVEGLERADFCHRRARVLGLRPGGARSWSRATPPRSLRAWSSRAQA